MTTPFKTFGYREDGSLTLCKARPENKGKGRCKHSDHIEVNEQQLKEGFLRKHNEKIYQEKYPESMTSISKDGYVVLKDPKKAKTKDKLSNPRYYMSVQALEKAADKVGKEFNKKDWTIIKKFCSYYNREMTEQERQENLHHDPVADMAKFIDSDDPIAIDLRKHLGSEINSKEISALIVENVNSMTSVIRWTRSKRAASNRLILTGLHNDMTKERYIASVLFFGGRCCYCDTPLNKGGNNRSTQATGEHLTPIAPQEGPPGSTRYGNMALACLGCNGERSNLPLEKWMSKTDRIPRDFKPKMYARIKEFRKFALYSEYTPQEVESIKESIEKLDAFIEDNKDEKGSIDPELVMNKVKIVLFDLMHGEHSQYAQKPVI